MVWRNNGGKNAGHLADSNEGWLSQVNIGRHRPRGIYSTSTASPDLKWLRLPLNNARSRTRD